MPDCEPLLSLEKVFLDGKLPLLGAPALPGRAQDPARGGGGSRQKGTAALVGLEVGRHFLFASLTKPWPKGNVTLLSCLQVCSCSCVLACVESDTHSHKVARVCCI